MPGWVCICGCVCVFSNSSQSLVLHFHRNCFTEKVSVRILETLDQTFVACRRRDRKRWLNTWLVKERKTACKSRQTGNMSKRGRFIDNWQWLDWRHSRFPCLSNLKSPQSFFFKFILLPNDCENKSKKSSGKRTEQNSTLTFERKNSPKIWTGKNPPPSYCSPPGASTPHPALTTQKCTKQEERLGCLGNSCQGNRTASSPTLLSSN